MEICNRHNVLLLRFCRVFRQVIIKENIPELLVTMVCLVLTATKLLPLQVVGCI